MFSTITYQYTNFSGGSTTTTTGTTSLGHIMAIFGALMVPIFIFSIFIIVCL